ncbi:MAG: LmeA family phospholipid-binding protein [Pseudanabaenaceae cyanobacterium]
MELLGAIATGLAAVAGLPGVVVDRMATDFLKQQLAKVEVLEVRVDNTPNHQILAGRVDRLRVAARGVYPLLFLRVDTLELETDPIEIDTASLARGPVRFRRPVQGAVRAVLQDADLNQALRSPAILGTFPTLEVNLAGKRRSDRYQLTAPELRFLAGNRVRVAAVLAPEAGGEALPVAVESGLALQAGTRLALVEPRVSLAGEPLPAQLVEAFARGLNRALDLEALAPQGLTVRMLQFQIEPGRLQLVGFAQWQLPQHQGAIAP